MVSPDFHPSGLLPLLPFAGCGGQGGVFPYPKIGSHGPYLAKTLKNALVRREIFEKKWSSRRVALACHENARTWCLPATPNEGSRLVGCLGKVPDTKRGKPKNPVSDTAVIGRSEVVTDTVALPPTQSVFTVYRSWRILKAEA